LNDSHVLAVFSFNCASNAGVVTILPKNHPRLYPATYTQTTAVSLSLNFTPSAPQTKRPSAFVLSSKYTVTPPEHVVSYLVNDFENEM
jgi:hypothetical protein